MSILISIISVIFVFGIVIFIHELGHFTSAKLFGVKVHEFAIGMGPALFKKQKGETLYSVRAIPMGGYVKMEGEDEASEDERSFSQKKPYQRLIILASGAFMNFLLGFLVALLTIVFTTPNISTMKVSQLMDGYDAKTAGIQVNDVIVKVNGNSVHNNLDMNMAFTDADVQNITVKRGSEKIDYNVKLTQKDGYKYLGVVREVQNKNLINVTSSSYHEMISIIKLTYKSFFGLFQGKVSMNDMSGPVGIVTEISNAAQAGIANLLFILMLISLNLGVVNLFPLPALDGGRIIFVLFEMITRKKVKPEFEAIVHFVGFVLLIGLMIYITRNDIVKLFQ